MTSVQGELVNILRATLSDRAEIRREAENAFLSNWVPRPSELFPQLVTVLLDSTQFSPEEQSLAAIFFRRWISRETDNENSAAWFSLNPEIQGMCKSGLLESFRRSQNRTVRNRISDAISQVANLVCQYEEWRELMGFLMVSLGDAQQTDDSVIALLRVITATPDLLTEQDNNSLNGVLSVLGGVVTSRPGVSVEAIQALASLTIFFYPDEKRRWVFAPVVTQIVPAVAQMMSGRIEEKEDELAQVLNSAADLVFECPRLFLERRGTKSKNASATLQQYVSMCGALIQRVEEDSYDSEDKLASAALEFICAAVEGNPAAFRRDQHGLLESSALILLQATGMESGTGEWLRTDPTDADDNLSISVLGQQSLDRFALALGGSTAGPVLFNHIGRLLSSADWRQKYSGLMGVASTAEGCAQDFLDDHLEGLLGLVWPCFGDAHPRVQYAACHALGQLCTDFPGRIQEEFARDALSALLSLLQRSQDARVQCHASAALVNFAEDCQSETIDPFLDGILGTLAGILANPASPAYLREQLIATIGAYSGAAQSRFAKFFDQLLPLLVAGLDVSSQPRKVQCRAVEALSLMLLAVKDAASLLQASLQAALPGFINHLTQLQGQMSACPADDPMREFLASAWLRMAQLMGPDFAPHLPVILPALLQTASAKIVFTELPEDEDEGNESENFIPAARVNGRNVGINTSLLTEKASALESLAALITAVGPKGFPECSNVFEVALSLINCEWSGDVRCAAVECACAAIEGVDYSESSIAALIAALLTGLEELYEAEFACSALDGLSTLFVASVRKQPGLNPLLATTLPKLESVLLSVLQLTCQNIRQIQEAQQDAAAGEDEAEEGEDGEGPVDGEDESGYLDTAEEEEVLYAWGRLEAALFEAFPQALESHQSAITFSTNQIKSSINPANKKKQNAKNKQASKAAAATSALENEALNHVCLGVLCDYVEWTGQAGCLARGQDLIDCCLTVLNSSPSSTTSSSCTSPLIRQVSAHLAGQLARHAGAPFKEFCVQAAAPLLAKLITKSDARAPSQLALTDNAVSALIRIHVAFPGSLSADTSAFIGQYLLPGLPVISDDAEINPVATFLLQNYNPQAVWAPAVLAALVTVKTTPSAAAHLKPEIVAALQPFLRDQLAQSSSKDRILSSLSNEQISRL